MAKKAQVESEPAVYGPAAQAVAAGKPSHIIVFREPSEKMVGVMQKAVHRYGAKSFAVAENVTGMGERRGGRAELQVFRQLGVAVSTLTEDEHQKLLRSDEVEAVVPNLRRYVQWLPHSAASRASGASVAGNVVSPRLPYRFAADLSAVFRQARPGTYGNVLGPTMPFGGTVGPILPFATGGSELLAYLAGQRDAIDALIARFGRPAGAPARPFKARGEEAGAALTWGLQAIGVTGADGQLTGAGVRVADLDTGLDSTHPDWATFPANDPGRARNFTQESSGTMDVVGHGTHTAGTIAGPLRSVGGTRYGVAPDCQLYVGKVLDDSGSGFDSDILEGIQWALANKCRVINMSLGAPRDVNGPYSVAYETVAKNVLDLDDGALIVAAAGNESARSQGSVAPVGNPAACPSIMAIAAVDEAMQVADFSCGQVDSIGIIDVAGPGVDVYSSVPVAQGRFDYYSGTSMATPHVTGLAACLLQANGRLTPRQVWDQIRAAARTLPLPPTDVGRGLASLP